MNNKQAIRNLFFQHWEDCKALSLSANQMDLVCLVHDCGVIRSSELAEYKDISIQSASCRMLLLHRMGYLKRTEEDDPTGGRIFAYELADDLERV